MSVFRSNKQIYVQIIDDLSGIFTRKDLEELGYGDFIKDYFDDGEG